MKKTSLLCAAFLIVMFANAQVNLSKGLMAYYPFNGNALDSSGNGNNPSFNNATLTTDRFGNANSAYYFNGNGSYMQIANSATLNTGKQLSISLWVNANGFYQGSCTGNYVLTKGIQTNLESYAVVFSDAPYGLYTNINFCSIPVDTNHESFYGDGLQTYTPSTPVVTTNKWYHIVYVYNGDSAYLYINNILVETGINQTPFTNTNDMFLGRYDVSSPSPYWLNGTLDDIRIYNRALDSAEVETLYHQGGFGTPTPTITSFTPNATCLGTSIPVFITGANLIGATAVTVGGSAVDSFKVNSSTSITAYISNGTTGNIVITTPNGNTTSDSTFTFGKGYTGYAYITNYNDGTVSVIKTSTKAIIATIPVGTNPYAVSISPDGNKAYVTNYGSNNVSVINTTTNSVTSTIAVGNKPTGIIVNNDGTKLYVVNNNNNSTGSISVINVATNSVTATIPIGKNPYGITITPDGKTIYVSNWDNNDLDIINTQTNQITATLGVGKNPSVVTINPTGSLVFVANNTGSNVSVINTATNTATTFATGNGTSGICFGPDGTKVYVSNDLDGTVTIYNTSNYSLIATVTVGNFPQGLNVSSDGSEVYVTNFKDKTISVINTVTNTLSSTVTVGNSPVSFGTFIANVPTACTASPCGSNNSQLVITVDTFANNPSISAKIGNIYPNAVAGTDKTEIAVFDWTDNGQGIPFYNARTLQLYNISKIPTNAVVNSAKLYYYAKTVGSTNGAAGQPTYGTNNAVLLQKCTSAWSASTLTWNNEPTVDVNTEVILPQSTNTAEDYVVDITNLAQGWVNKPDSNFGFLLRMQTESNPYNSMIFEAGQAFDTTRNARLEICYSVPTALPITLQSFTASAITFRYTSVQFATTNETNAASIEIERGYDGINFSAAGSLTAKGNVGLNQYSFTDKVNPNATIAYYRLKLINKDGTFAYSAIISVQLSVNNDQYSIYPNPAKKFIMVNGKNINQVNIIDNLGRVVVTKKGLSASSILTKVEFSLSPGIYVAQLSTSDGKIVNEKFVVQ